jgi:O-antigen/teichoic acid export membrane protein
LKTLIQRAGKHLTSEHLHRRARVVAVYLTGQGLVQIITLLIGLLMLRWLAVTEYAQFSLAFSFQTTFSMLTDMGITATITALVGTRINDARVVGEYVRSGRHVRNLMLLVLSPLALVFYIYIAHLHQWGIFSSALLFLSIVVSVYASGMISCFTPPLLIHRQLSSYYRFSLFSVLLRGAASAAMHFLHLLNAWIAAWINTAALFLYGLLCKRKALNYAELPATTKREITRQMFQYSLPAIPSAIFFALQGQISIFLISIFGNTRNIAEMGALGRLGQLFLLLSGFNQMVIEPFMARQPKQRVARYFLLILLVAVGISTVICLLGFMEPQWILWLLGPNYSQLQHETGWLLLSSCFSYITGVVWYMTTARRWIYWSTSWLTIALIIGAQAVFLSQVRIDTTLHAIWFMTASTAAQLLAVLFNSVYGFIRGPRIKIDGDHEPHLEPVTEPQEL